MISTNIRQDVVLDLSGGVHSATDDSSLYLQPHQCEWAFNVGFTGGRARTRPPMVEVARWTLPAGATWQGAGYLSVRRGMLVLAIGGRFYRWSPAASETMGIVSSIGGLEVSAEFPNNPERLRAWFMEANGTLYIQDGESACVLYDGGTARRAVRVDNEIPIGTCMAFNGSRIWLARGSKLWAGDIAQGQGEERFFTEIQDLVGGGALTALGAITALRFIPRLDSTTGFGSLLVSGKAFMQGVRADVPQRSAWPELPDFQTTLFEGVGSIGDLVPVNQDLYWRSADGQLRSLRSAVVDADTPGNAPLSHEIERLFGYDSVQVMDNHRMIYAGNRLLMLTQPYLVSGRTHYQRLASLSFVPLSKMGQKAPPLYEGEWSGSSFVDLQTGVFDGKTRAFAFGLEGQTLRIFELMGKEADDRYLTSAGPKRQQVTASLELRKTAWGEPRVPKRFMQVGVDFSEVEGGVTLRLFYRMDYFETWRPVNTHPIVLQSEVAGVVRQTRARPHRTGYRTFAIPDEINPVTRRAYNHGYVAQVRIEWTGNVRIDRVDMQCQLMEASQRAEDSRQSDSGETESVTNTRDAYMIPTSA